jgi:ankyrin repeat protein
MNNYDCNVALLIDFGANMEHENVAGNSPLHVAASRNCKESTKWLLTRGADKNKPNKAGKTAWDCGIQANCTEICEIIEKFTENQIGIF